MILRILAGAGLLLLGYYVGREIGRAEPIRKELKDARDLDKKKSSAIKQSTKNNLESY